MQFQMTFKMNVPIKIIKRKKWFLASCPVLDIHSQGETEYLTINPKTGKPFTTMRKALKRAVTLSLINKPATTIYSVTHSALMQFGQKRLEWLS